MSAGEIADHFHLAKPTMSGHFQVLRAADLVHSEKAGASVIYRLNLSVLEEALMALMDGFGLLASGKSRNSLQRKSKPS